ncbi:MAG: phosphonate ABC transporter ATP-binding protein [Moraxellaceae bacterium]|nr:MAG: phosphonate ABC transporter ATP-binding protein [Moraxellaceae bacterium]
MLELVGHHSGYRKREVLRDVNVAIESGERVAVVGESGAGKSTLLRQLYQLSPKTIALCPQSLGLVSTLSAFHNIYMGRLNQPTVFRHLLNLCWPQTDAWNQVLLVAQQVGVEDLLRQPVSRLSGGQQQRVALARALVQGQAQTVTTFIGDEPVSSVDQKHGGLLLDVIRRQFSTVVVAIHDQTLALNYFDRVIGVRQGQIEFDARASDLSLEDLSVVCRGQ